jgi:hypothetical protein
MKLKEANIISFLINRELGQLQQLFMNRIVILSRP